MRAWTEGQGLVAVTRRPAVRLRLIAVSAEIGLPAPIFRERVDDALADDASIATVMILDLGSCSAETRLPHLVHRWRRRSPGSELVLFAPLLDPESELRTTLALMRSARDVDPCVMTASDFYRDESWHILARVRTHAMLARQLRSDLLSAIGRTGRALRAAAEVLLLLERMPRHAPPAARRTGASTGAPTGLVTTVPDLRTVGDRERKALWKRLRRAGQLPASRLLSVFRVLWYTKLREDGWPTVRVAELLGFPSAAEFRRTMRRRLGIGVRDLGRIRYEDALSWAAELVVAEHAGPGGRIVPPPGDALRCHRS